MKVPGAPDGDFGELRGPRGNTLSGTGLGTELWQDDSGLRGNTLSSTGLGFPIYGDTLTATAGVKLSQRLRPCVHGSLG